MLKSVAFSRCGISDSVSYGITNFEFFGTETVETRTYETISYNRSLIKLKLQAQEKSRIDKRSNYEEIVDYIKSSRDAGVTCAFSDEVYLQVTIDRSKEIAWQSLLSHVNYSRNQRSRGSTAMPIAKEKLLIRCIWLEIQKDTALCHF